MRAVESISPCRLSQGKLWHILRQQIIRESRPHVPITPLTVYTMDGASSGRCVGEPSAVGIFPINLLIDPLCLLVVSSFSVKEKGRNAREKET